MRRTIGEIIRAIYVNKRGDWEAIYDAIKRKVSTEDMGITDSDFVQPSANEPCIVASAYYPEHFKSAYKPPFIIRLFGNVALLDGSKNTLFFPSDATLKSVQTLCKKKVIPVLAQSSPLACKVMSRKPAVIVADEQSFEKPEDLWHSLWLTPVLDGMAPDQMAPTVWKKAISDAIQAAVWSPRLKSELGDELYDRLKSEGKLVFFTPDEGLRAAADADELKTLF